MTAPPLPLMLRKTGESTDMHNISLDPELVSWLTAERGGSYNVIDRLDPARTAHIVIDMQNGFVEPGAPVETPIARAIVPNVNAIAQATRRAGARNYFLQFTTPVDDLGAWSFFYARSSPQTARQHQAAFTPGAHYWQLWPAIDFDPATDRCIGKQRYSAFVPGTCPLDAELRAQGIDTLIVTGTLTNCCCESTARDAMQRNYRVIFATDANAALNDAAHNATLNNMLMLFADVRPASEIVGLLQPALAPASA